METKSILSTLCDFDLQKRHFPFLPCISLATPPLLPPPTSSGARESRRIGGTSASESNNAALPLPSALPVRLSWETSSSMRCSRCVPHSRMRIRYVEAAKQARSWAVELVTRSRTSSGPHKGGIHRIHRMRIHDSTPGRWSSLVDHRTRPSIPPQRYAADLTAQVQFARPLGNALSQPAAAGQRLLRECILRPADARPLAACHEEDLRPQHARQGSTPSRVDSRESPSSSPPGDPPDQPLPEKRHPPSTLNPAGSGLRGPRARAQGPEIRGATARSIPRG